MRTILAFLTFALAGLMVSAQPAAYVDPFVGTDGMGHTFPGACVPMGSIQLSPDTDIVPHNINGIYQNRTYDYCAGYRHSDSTIVGFSHRHLSGTGHSDLGDILIMPVTGPVRLDGYKSRFSHDTETASPGLYEVTLADYGIRARLTATKRVGVHQYEYPSEEAQHIILDLTHSIYGYDGKVCRATLRVENDTLVTGFRLTDGWARTNYTYFAISFSKPIRDYGYKDRHPSSYGGFWRRFDIGHNFPDMAGRDIVSWFSFDEGEPLTVKVAISAVDAAGAVRNLQAEGAGTFDELAAKAAAAWDKELGRFEVEGTESEKTMFYTSIYHTLIHPSVYMDVDGKYRGVDGNIHEADGFTNYTIFSLWDTYRAEHPFLGLFWPDENSDMIRSMVEHWKQNAVGMLPVWSLMGNENWCMSGYHAVPVLADAIVKGTYKGSVEEALAAMAATSKVRIYEGLGFYMDHGYVPLDESGTAASTTLEYSYDDWTIHAAALKTGNKELAGEYGRRAMNYANVYDTSIGYARPRYADGSFKEQFDIDQTYGEGFIEGNSRNFSFHVPQDVNGLMKLMGGEKQFLKKLENLFAMDLAPEYYADNEDIEKECLVGGYVHGNEPSHHVPYLFAWTSKPWLTQYWVREIMNRMYREGIDGLGGNDDCGQMSAWYLFSAMGFYPVCPGTDQYVIGAPYLPYVKITLPGGNTLEIKAKGVSDRNRYVKRVRINGKPLDRRYVTQEDILQGGVWEFEMSARPSGNDRLRKPYSFSDNN